MKSVKVLWLIVLFILSVSLTFAVCNEPPPDEKGCLITDGVSHNTTLEPNWERDANCNIIGTASVSGRVELDDPIYQDNCFVEVQIQLLYDGQVVVNRPIVKVHGDYQAYASDSATFSTAGYADPTKLSIKVKTFVWGCFLNCIMISCREESQSYYHEPPCIPSVPSVSYTFSGSTTKYPRLTWSPVSTADRYEIYRQVKRDGIYYSWGIWGTVTGTSFTDTMTKVLTGTPADDAVFYKVRSVGANGLKSSFSAVGTYMLELSTTSGPGGGVFQ